MELTLETGRPSDTTGRLEKEIRVYDFLDSLNIPYQRVDHEALMTIEACKDVDKILDAVICKNLFLCNRQETNFYLLLLPGDKKFKTKEVSSQLGVARLSFGNETYMEKYLDITPGSVSVLGLMNDKEHHVQLLIDEDLLKEPYIGCHPCINTSSLRLRTEDLLKKIRDLVQETPAEDDDEEAGAYVKIRNDIDDLLDTVGMNYYIRGIRMGAKLYTLLSGGKDTTEEM